MTKRTRKRLPPTASKGGLIIALEMAVRERMAELDAIWIIRESENTTIEIMEAAK
jgi:hypothetical protein